MRECELNTSDFVFYFSTSAVFLVVRLGL